MIVSASSPGNLFLCGEHAVVYGYPAVICSIDKRTRVSIERSKDEKIRIDSDAFGSLFAKIEKDDIIPVQDNKDLHIFLDILRSLEITTGFNATISSEIPVKSGMSSSTAVMSSFLTSLANVFSLDISAKDHYNILLPVQRAIHGGKASGAEIYSSSIGGFHKIEKENDIMKGVRIPGKDLDIVVADTRVHAPTYLTVKYHIPSLIERKRKEVFDTFEQIGSITGEIETALEKGDKNKLGSLLDENQMLLSTLGVSHPKLDDCIEEAIGAGALGAKLSGSGWGGVMFALVEKDTKDDVYNALMSTGAKVIRSKIGVEGTREEAV